MGPILKRIQEITEEVLSKEFRRLNDLEIPKKQGVYVIKNLEKNEVFYVGKSNNLLRRLVKAHIKGLLPSSLRKSLLKIGGIENLNDYLTKKCEYVIRLIEDPDINSSVESLLIAVLRDSGEPLLNK